MSLKDVNIENLTRSIQEFSEVNNDIIDVIWTSERYTAQADRFLYTMFTKLHFILSSLDFHVFNLERKPNYIITIGLALRTCMFDLINLYYVLDARHTPTVMELRINQIMIDHLKRTVNILSADHLRELAEEWPGLFENGALTQKIKCPRTAEMLEIINLSGTFKDEVAHAYKNYDILSKYEHNGAFTFHLLHTPFNVRETSGKQIVGCSIFEVMLGIKCVSEHWLTISHPLAIRQDQILRRSLKQDFIGERL